MNNKTSTSQNAEGLKKAYEAPRINDLDEVNKTKGKVNSTTSEQTLSLGPS